MTVTWINDVIGNFDQYNQGMDTKEYVQFSYILAWKSFSFWLQSKHECIKEFRHKVTKIVEETVMITRKKSHQDLYWLVGVHVSFDNIPFGINIDNITNSTEKPSLYEGQPGESYFR